MLNNQLNFKSYPLLYIGGWLRSDQSYFDTRFYELTRLRTNQK